MTEQPDLKARVEELRRVAEAATQEPWIADNGEGFSAWTIWARMTPTGHGAAGTFIAQVVGDSAETDANAAFIATFDPPTVLTLLSRITDLEAERDEARNELAAHDRAMANERRRWREHPMMQRLDEVRRSIAGLRPGDAEWLATAQSEFLDVEARAQAAETRLALAEKVVEAGRPFSRITATLAREVQDDEPVASTRSYYGNVIDRMTAGNFRALTSALTAYAEGKGNG